ncbi:hypothetical protein EKO27_g10727 [Xylaria grammica]|uniref:Symplekin/Pta1 N-terminal domain-containing protein n=1 Tax=Xylaria grammica TaxID=363999 RepID=A0A439CQD8_9PEZI|nr:hypothetical protein EKO27_g10727 [Xylaria grammica]
MAATPQLSVADQIRQLEGARKLVLKDVSYYPQVIQATLPIIGPSSQVEFRRWGSEFLAEAFATPAVPLSSKETLSLVVLDTLKSLVEDPKQDVLVLRGVIQAAASIYPLAMRWIVNPEPRRGDPLDISRNMVPPNHPALDGDQLEAEASGLLDRMLSALEDETRDVHNPLAGRMQQYVERLVRSRAEIFDENGRKRVMVDQTSAVEAKRQRTATLSSQPQIEITPLKHGENSLAEVFTFTNNEAPLAAKISVRTIAQLDTEILQRAIGGVRARLAAFHEAHQQPINPETAPLDVEEDDDDYEPDYYAAEDTEQLMNKLDSSPSDERRDLQAPVLGALTLPAFKLPPPPTLDPEQAARVGQGAIARVFGTMQTLEDPATKKSKAGLNRLAASSYDRDSWITVITRLATRANAGLDEISVKDEDSALALPTVSMSDSIRELLYAYVLEDFRKRIDVAVTWLSEEWYKERVQQRFTSPPGQPYDAPANFEKWTLRLIDAFLPYLHSQDKILTRFLSELPELTVSILARVNTLCRDPSLVNLALTSLYYLVMFRPPVRNIALDTIQDIWTEYEDARPTAAKYLQRWRPGFVDAAQQGARGASSTPVGTNGAVVAT